MTQTLEKRINDLETALHLDAPDPRQVEIKAALMTEEDRTALIDAYFIGIGEPAWSGLPNTEERLEKSHRAVQERIAAFTHYADLAGSDLATVLAGHEPTDDEVSLIVNGFKAGPGTPEHEEGIKVFSQIMEKVK